ncbi:MAG TPA: amidohydrolase family protein [Bryobacteraceae bacterium]
MKTAKTKVIDLHGRTVIPGITDAHLHMWFGALTLHGFNFWTAEERLSPDDGDTFVEKLKEFAAKHPSDKVLFGRAHFDFATGAKSSANRQLLDRAVPDRAVVIHQDGEHAMWVNSKALEMAHITDKPVADPEEEKFVVRDAQGHPTGLLVEPAMQIMERSLPPLSTAQRAAMLRDAAHELNRYGITSVVNATGDLKQIEALAFLRDRGELTVRTKTAFGKVSVKHHLTPQFLSDLGNARALYHDEWVSANLVKFFADGEGKTVSRYVSGDGGEYSPGWYTPKEFQQIVTELDRRGYQIMTHSIGNAASHMVLDAYQAAEKANGPRDRRFRMEHAGSFTPQDVPRLAQLFVAHVSQPAFCCRADNPPRKSSQWESFEKSGAHVAFSSDWPCTWPPDVFDGIQEAVTRRVRDFDTEIPAVPAQYSLPAERLTAQQALDAYTKGSAWVAFAENRTGTLEPGKDADLAVLSQDFLDVPPDRIDKTRVLLTMVGGKVVFNEMPAK